MSEKFRPLSDLPECDSLEENKMNQLPFDSDVTGYTRFELGRFDEITDTDLQGELKRVEEACKESSTNRLMLLQEVSSSNNFDSDLLNSTSDFIGEEGEYIDEKLSGNITYTVEHKDTLGEIIQSVYGLNKWSEISQKLEEVYLNNPGLTQDIQEGDEISLVIDDVDEYSDRMFKKGYDKRTKILLEIDKAREKLALDFENKTGKTPIINADISSHDEKLYNDMYSGKLNSDAYEVYQNMKNTRGTQVIGQYRNNNGEVKNIILGDNMGKNIYMELDGSYRWDDIDSGKIDYISSQKELEYIMKELLKKYENKNREEI